MTGIALLWEALSPEERRLVLRGGAPYTDATSASLFWEPHPFKPGMRLSGIGRRVADHGRRLPG